MGSLSLALSSPLHRGIAADDVDGRCALRHPRAARPPTWCADDADYAADARAGDVRAISRHARIPDDGRSSKKAGKKAAGAPASSSAVRLRRAGPQLMDAGDVGQGQEGRAPGALADVG